MRTILFTLFLAAAVSGCSSVVVKEYRNVQEVSLSELQSKQLSLADFGKAIVVVRKGDKLPISIKTRSKIANLVEKRVHLEFKRNLYLRCQLPKGFTKGTVRAAKQGDAQARVLLRKVTIFVSSDKRRWSPISSMSGLKEVLGIKKGHFSVGLSLSKERGLLGSLFLEML